MYDVVFPVLFTLSTEALSDWLKSLYTLYYLQADVDNVGSDFDLNSLIEGDVDDEDSAEDNDQDSRTPVVRTYYEPLKVRFQQLLLPQLLASDDVQWWWIWNLFPTFLFLLHSLTY